MISINGTHIDGLGIATETISLQREYFIEYLPNIEDLFIGTINLKLVDPVVISNPDIITKHIKWSDKFPAEEFSFTEAKVMHQPSEIVKKCWIYEASLSPNRRDPFIVEVLTEFLEFKKYDHFTLLIEKDVIKHSAYIV